VRGWRRADPGSAGSAHSTRPVSQGRPALPAAATAALGLGRGERVLAVAGSGAGWLVATGHRFGQLDGDAGVRWLRPWHEVDSASWSRAADALTLTFVDSRRPVELPVDADATFLQVVRERVQASVVVSLDLPLDPPRRARAALRQDLATGAIVEQLVLGRGTLDSPEVAAAAAVAFARLRDDVGIPPR
jgi:hypothetical protein